GVAITHAGVIRLVLHANYVRLDSEQVLLQMAAVSFDASTFELWGALLCGARCILFPNRIPSVRAIGEAVDRDGLTTLWLTASLFNMVIDEAPQLLRPITQLLIGGEALSVDHVRRALGLLSSTA